MKPSNLRCQGFASVVERSQQRAIDRGKVGHPLTFLVRLDVRATLNIERADGSEVYRFPVHALHATRSRHHDLHDRHRGRRRILRRGRSTIIPSSDD